MRTTPKELRETIARLQRKGFDVSISWAYGKPRVYNKDESKEISPRLPVGQMKVWLEGFETAAGLLSAQDREVIKYAAQYVAKGIADNIYPLENHAKRVLEGLEWMAANV